MDFVYVHGETPILVDHSKALVEAIANGVSAIIKITRGGVKPNTLWLNAAMLELLTLQEIVIVERSMGLNIQVRESLKNGTVALFDSDRDTTFYPRSALVLQVPNLQ